eukprot:scaffold36583_cov63-Phaeocystis_antarctica.AAC.2
MPPGQTAGWRPCSHEVAPGSTIATALDRYYFCGRTGTVEHQPASMLRLEYVLAVAQLSSCASSGRAWRPWAAWHSQDEAWPLGSQPLPRVLKPAASKAAHFTAFDHLGSASSTCSRACARACAACSAGARRRGSCAASGCTSTATR